MKVAFTSVALSFAAFCGLIHTSASDRQVSSIRPRYKIQELAPLAGDSNSYSRAINNRSDVVGSSDDHAVIWSSGSVRVLKGLADGVNVAEDINDRRQIAGTSDTKTGDAHAVIWEAGVTRDLGTLGGRTSSGVAINDLGHIIGESRSVGNKRRRAFVWKDGIMHELPGPTEDDCFASDINEVNQASGYCVDEIGNSSALLWSTRTKLSFEKLPKPASTSRCLTKSGIVIGQIDLGASSEGGYAFEFAHGNLSILGPKEGFTVLVPTAVNKQGIVVGTMRQPGGQLSGLIMREGIPLNLNSLLANREEWRVERALSVNDRGQIVGYGFRAGHARGFVLSPIEN